MRSVLRLCARALGLEKNAGSVSPSDSEDWGIENMEQQVLCEQLEYYFSGTNLERDQSFREEVGKDQEGYVHVDYILNCNRVKNMAATGDDVIAAAAGSIYLEVDPARRCVRSKIEFVPDPARGARTIRVSGLGHTVPQSAQIPFFESIFGEKVLRVSLVRHETEGGEIVYSGTTIVELSDAEAAREAADCGIKYGDGILSVTVMNTRQQQVHKEKRGKSSKRSPRRA